MLVINDVIRQRFVIFKEFKKAKNILLKFFRNILILDLFANQFSVYISIVKIIKIAPFSLKKEFSFTWNILPLIICIIGLIFFSLFFSSC